MKKRRFAAKVLTCLLALVMLLSLVPAAVADEPTEGEGKALKLTADMLTLGMKGDPNETGKTGLTTINATNVKQLLVDGLTKDAYDGAMNDPTKTFVSFNRNWEGTPDASKEDGGLLNSGYYVEANLGEVYDLKNFSIDFLAGKSLASNKNRRNSGIGAPTTPALYTSENGTDWTKVADMELTKTESGNYEKHLYTLTRELKSQYVRFEFAREWVEVNDFKGTDTFTMIDEVVISNDFVPETESDPEPLKPITLNAEMVSLGFSGTPNATGTEQIPKIEAAKGLLVDGKYGDLYPYAMNDPAASAYVGFQGGWEGAYNESEYNKGWGNGGYHIEFDLGKTEKIVTVKMDFLYNLGAGIGGPADLVLKVSDDKTDWTKVDVEPTHEDTPCQSNTAHVKSLYTFDLTKTRADVNARYVRLEFKRAEKDDQNVYSFICFDEVIISNGVEPEGPIILTKDMLNLGMVGTPNETGVTGLATANSFKGLLIDGKVGASYDSFNNEKGSYVAFNRAWEGGPNDESKTDQGWGNSGYYIDVNLGETKDLKKATIDFVAGKVLNTGRRNAGIGEPTVPELLVSDDGKEWKKIDDMKGLVTPVENANYEKILYTLEQEFSGQYIRFAFKRPVVVEEKGITDTFTMIDEITISNGIEPEPVAPEEPGTIPGAEDPKDFPGGKDANTDTVITDAASIAQWGLSDPTWHYNNQPAQPLVEEIEKQSYDRLLDGVFAFDHPDLFTKETNWVSKPWDDKDSGRGLYVNMYHGGDRDIIIDLGEVRNLTTIGMSLGISDPPIKEVRKEDSYGIYFPTSVKYFLSENGTDYYYVGEVTQPRRAQLGYALDAGLMNIEDINYNARYLRILFSIDVFVFPDEIIARGNMEPSKDADDLTKLEKFESVSHVVNKWPDYEMSGGIHHDYLAYQGWGTVNADIVETYRTVRDLRAVVAYLDVNGKPLDWLYDSVTFMGHGWTKEKSTYLLNSSVPNGPYANKEDWLKQLEHTFNYVNKTEAGVEEITGVDALETAVGEIKKELKPSSMNGLSSDQIANHKVAVKIPVYPAIPVEFDWGSLKAGDPYVNVKIADDGTLSYTVTTLDKDKELKFTLAAHKNDEEALLSDVASMFLWYMQLVEKKFEAKNYENIYLDGFYYFEEKASVAQNPTVYNEIRIYNMMVDEMSKGGKDYSAYWIPFYTAEGYKDWETLGFDYAVMQPNGYGYDQPRMDTAARLAKTYGLSIEMEWMGTAAGYVETFISYLQTGIDTGYQKTPQAWYWGTWDFTRIAYNEESCAGLRYLYDYVYRYIKGYSTLVESTPSYPSYPSAPASANKSFTVDENTTTVLDVEAKIGDVFDITVRNGGTARVEIPVTGAGYGTVAVIVNKDGTETVIRDCVLTDKGIAFDVKGSVTVKIENRGMTFTDMVSAGKWAKDAVEYVSARGLLTGTGVNTFSPASSITRGMAATVLFRFAGEPEGAKATFTDVAEGKYYAQAVAWTEENNIVTGYGDGTFKPGRYITREQLVAIIYRYAKLRGLDLTVKGGLESYDDAATVAEYARDAMTWCVENGIINGVDSHTLRPKGDTTRAQAAAIVMRLCQLIGK